jgi:hypothetical protein
VPDAPPDLPEALALNSAGLAEQKTLYDAAGIDRGTANAT